MDAVCMRTTAVPLTGVFGHVIVSSTEHGVADLGAAAVCTVCPVYHRDLHLLQRVRRSAHVAHPTPAADCSRGGRGNEGLSKSLRSDADGTNSGGERDGGFEVQQGDVVVVQTFISVVEWVNVFLQHFKILLCVFLDEDVVFTCKKRRSILAHY